jgi:hypothetical protein
MVLGLSTSGDVRISPLDIIDRSQLWKILEWGLGASRSFPRAQTSFEHSIFSGRFVTHVQTSKLLSIGPDGISLVLAPGNAYTEGAMWAIDLSNSTARNISGFFHLRPAIKPASRSVQPKNQTIPPAGTPPVLSSVGSFGCRFISTSESFNFTWRAKMLETFIKSKMPIFVHAKGTPSPIDVTTYLSHSTLVNKSDPARSLTTQPTLKTPRPGDWVLHTNIPVNEGKTATAYIIVRPATEPVYLNYTDFTIWLLYAPASPKDASKGWRFVTMRVNNDSKRIEAVHFPDGGQGWIYNIDLSFSALGNIKNPLRFIKSTSGTMRLRLCVESDLTITPFFPPSLHDSDIVDAMKWGLMLDSGTNSQVIEADMIRDDRNESRPLRPQWLDYKGSWFDGIGTGAHGPD